MKAILTVTMLSSAPPNARHTTDASQPASAAVASTTGRHAARAARLLVIGGEPLGGGSGAILDSGVVRLLELEIGHVSRRDVIIDAIVETHMDLDAAEEAFEFADLREYDGVILLLEPGRGGSAADRRRLQEMLERTSRRLPDGARLTLGFAHPLGDVMDSPAAETFARDLVEAVRTCSRTVRLGASTSVGSRTNPPMSWIEPVGRAAAESLAA